MTEDTDGLKRGRGRPPKTQTSPPPPKRRTRRRFGHLRRLPSGRWQAKYPGPDGKFHTAPHTFKGKGIAEQWLVDKESEIGKGEWRAPQRGKETVATWAERWIASKINLKPKTKADYEMTVRVYIVPRFGDTPISKITRADVQAWVQDLTAQGLSVSSVRRAIGGLNRIFGEAIISGALENNPCQRISLPRQPKSEVEPLTLEQVRALANAIEHPVIKSAGNGARPVGRSHFPEYSLLIRFTVFTGLRAGEVAGLTRKAVDLDKGEVRITETLSEVRGHLYTVPPKTYQSRSVPLPRFLVRELREHLATLDDDPDGYVFRAPTGTPLRWQGFYNRHFKPAVRQAGLPESTRFHDLRHTFAAILIDQGAHPRAMMERLGHSSINVTLGTYGHLLPGLDEELTRKLDAIWE